MSDQDTLHLQQTMANHAKQLKKDGEPLCAALAPAYRVVMPTLAGRIALTPELAEHQVPQPSAPMADRAYAPPPAAVPRLRRADAWVAILHLFSGHRRVADYQYCFEAMQLATNCICISLDIVTGGCNADISRPQVRQFWHDRIAAGL
eukprot:8039275-Lingulodinium_polyedra.AAC.1